MGRVMDAPVDQDVLTWDGGIGLMGARLSKPFQSSVVRPSQTLAVIEGCGLLADGEACRSINHSGIRRDRARLLGDAGRW